MVATSNGEYNWAEAVKEFDETKAGVKGLVDAGVTELPRLFVHPPEDLHSHPPRGTTDAQLPTIDFHGVESSGARRREVVEQISKASSEWGFFRIVNHGIPLETMDSTLDAVKRFHELPSEEKTPFYSYDMSRLVKLNSSLPTKENKAASWRDILTCNFKDGQLDPKDIPSACRYIYIYIPFFINY